MHMPWKWDRLSANHNITFHDVVNQAHQHLWHKQNISYNPRMLEVRYDDADYIDAVKFHLMAFRIQWRWHQAINNPKYALCRKRLMKMFAELQ
jgi:hypothetical protein